MKTSHLTPKHEKKTTNSDNLPFFFIQNKQKQKLKERKQLSDELNYF